MQSKQTNIQLRDATRYNVLKGHYRLLDVKMCDHHLAEFEFIVTVSDGETELKLSTFSSVRLPIGGFVYVEASFKDNGVGGRWSLHLIRLSNVEEALGKCGYEVDVARQRAIAKMPLPQHIKQIADPSLLKIKDMFIENYSKQREIERCFSFYDGMILGEALSWVFSVKFDNDKQRDYAAVGLMLWIGFKHYVDSNNTLVAGVHDMQKFRDFIAQGIATLSKFDEELAAFFESIMSQNLMLNVSESRLSECPVSIALQVVYFHASTVPNFYEEKRYG